jgi:OOP family OmpA-OmpF porin
MRKYLQSTVFLSALLTAWSAAGTSYHWYAFFEPNSTELNSNAVLMVRDMMGWHARQCLLRLELVGHVDGAESLNSGSALDTERALAVAAQFRREGLDRLEIAIRSMRFTQPLVQTPEGVAEPQKRRVEMHPAFGDRPC